MYLILIYLNMAFAISLFIVFDNTVVVSEFEGIRDQRSAFAGRRSPMPQPRVRTLRETPDGSTPRAPRQSGVPMRSRHENFAEDGHVVECEFVEKCYNERGVLVYKSICVEEN